MSLDKARKLFGVNREMPPEMEPSTLERLHQLINQRHTSKLTSTILNLFIERIETPDNQHTNVYYKFKN